VSRLALETHTQKKRIKRKKGQQKKKELEEGEKEMEMMSAKVSGGCELAGPVRVM